HDALHKAIGGDLAPTHIGNIDIELAKVFKRLGPVDDLNAMRDSIRRSLDDPRPSLTEEEAEAEMDRFMKGQEKASRNAAR
ncbi:hypothetical protein ACC739_37650, partial [Rhizobium ruizarguesonis]